MHQKADALLQKHHLRSINDVLKQKPDLILGVVKHLESKGVTLPKLDSFGKRKSRSKTELPDGEDDGVKEEAEQDGLKDNESPAKVRKTGRSRTQLVASHVHPS